ncbi:MAG: hypothetical protein IPG64_16485 [Haliea sp.]|nr:hypothetical protein [Haliea sp.]
MRALISKPMDLQFSVLNMLMGEAPFSDAAISIRGIDNLVVGSASDSGTGNHFNGVYLNNGRIFEMEFYDAERVEVLRPTGPVVRAATPPLASNVNFITRKPEDGFGGDFIVEGNMTMPRSGRPQYSADR